MITNNSSAPAAGKPDVRQGAIARYGRKTHQLILSLLLVATGAWATPADTFDDLMNRARQAQVADKSDEAAELYRAALRIRPHSGPAEYGLGLMVSVQKKYEEAVELLTNAIHDDPSLIDADLFRGIAYLNLQRPDRALTCLEHFYRLKPRDPEVRFYLGGAYNALGDYPKAAEYYSAQLAITPERPELWYFLGESLLNIPRQMRTDLLNGARGKYFSWMLDAQQQAEKGDLVAAARDFREAMTADPANPEAYIGLGNLLLGEGKHAEAKRQFIEAARRSPQNCRALEGLGDAELAQGNVAGSIAEYAKVAGAKEACLEEPLPVNLGLAPRQFADRLRSVSEYAGPPQLKVAARFEFSRLKASGAGAGEPGAQAPVRQAGRNEAARYAAAPPCRSTIPNREWLVSRYGNLFLAGCLEDRADIHGALKALSAAEPQSGRDAVTDYWTFRLYMRLTQRIFAELANRAPQSYLLSEVQAESMELQGRDAEAEAAYRKAIASSEGDPLPSIEFARFKCKRNEPDDAIAVLKEALARAPYNTRANELMGQAYFMKADYAAAIPYLLNGGRADPGNEENRIQLGQSLAKVGKIQQAISVLEGAPSDRDGRIHYVLAGFYRKLGQKEQMARALAFFEQHKAQPQRRQASD